MGKGQRAYYKRGQQNIQIEEEHRLILPALRIIHIGKCFRAPIWVEGNDPSSEVLSVF